VRARTYRQLLDSGMRLIQQRGLVSVAEIAADAGVSRATAYRYFPSRSRLVSAVIEESLGPVRRFDSVRTDGRSRLRDLFDQTFPRFKRCDATSARTLGDGAGSRACRRAVSTRPSHADLAPRRASAAAGTGSGSL